MTHRKHSNLLVLFILASIAAYFPNADGATTFFIPSATPPSKKGSGNSNRKDVLSAAKSMNSVAFLSKLVSFKDTSNVDYFKSQKQEPAVANIARGGGVASQKQKKRGYFLRRVATAARSGTVRLSAGRDDIHEETIVDSEQSHGITDGGVASKLSETTTTEYTGNLWFMRNKGIRFRETVGVSDVSSDGKYATVEVHTKYRTGGKWHDCSRVTCKLSAVDRGINMVTDSELLVKVPFPGLAGKKVRSKITGAFETAAKAFFDVGEEAFEAENNNVPADELPTRTQLAKGFLWYAY